MVADLLERGYALFPHDSALAAWVRAVRPAAQAAIEDEELRAKWLVCKGTWFVGVDALANDASGSVDGSGPLTGAAIEVAQGLFGSLALHPAQLSVVWPGYPQPRDGESEAAFRFRLKRDAAHLDGIKAQGPERKRFIDELHAWILGVPLNETAAGASPMVIWDGSHEVMRRGLLGALEEVPESRWHEVDLTAAYQAARREVFETCQRVELHARPGEAYLLHRLCLHGVAPWRAGADEAGRVVAYFRPELPGGVGKWLRAP
ncbi:hypothetical protein [Marimonas lutisalis]|uniref:hypothetical protein n=1 Tax=Marimonas lutisalis TaxID=2545756 RepID=UPI0010F4937E|nr:hypothetical protein [Marimonas lutisalis]